MEQDPILARLDSIDKDLRIIQHQGALDRIDGKLQEIVRRWAIYRRLSWFYYLSNHLPSLLPVSTSTFTLRNALAAWTPKDDFLVRGLPMRITAEEIWQNFCIESRRSGLNFKFEEFDTVLTVDTFLLLLNKMLVLITALEHERGHLREIGHFPKDKTPESY
jgi:hypothetical protein